MRMRTGIKIRIRMMMRRRKMMKQFAATAPSRTQNIYIYTPLYIHRYMYNGWVPIRFDKESHRQKVNFG